MIVNYVFLLCSKGGEEGAEVQFMLWSTARKKVVTKKTQINVL